MRKNTIRFLEELLADDLPERWQLAKAQDILRIEQEQLDKWRDQMQAKRKVRRMSENLTPKHQDNIAETSGVTHGRGA